MCGVMYLGFTLLGMGPKDLTLVWFHIIPKKKKKNSNKMPKSYSSKRTCSL